MLASKKTNIVLHIIFLLLVVVMLFPIILTVSISLSSSKSIIEYGYNIIPKEF